MTRTVEDIVSDMRHVFAHRYHQLDLDLMWTNMSVSVPALVAALNDRSDSPEFDDLP